LLAGLLSEDEAADPERVVELIFAPGISTASEVSRLSGRGIGMDVLKSEVTSLGGRIEVVSSLARGRPSGFTCRSPWRSRKPCWSARATGNTRFLRR
jgi:chemotaxis protein histidine kinase CheA